MARYQIPRTRVRVEIRVSNSRFIATLAPAFTAKEAHALVRELRNEMPDATHHVYAFRIGYGASITEGMSDDGEPSGTAGPPAMAVVRGSDVGDVALVITRYFGGTKLGTGGLVSAYSAAAKAAFAVLETEEKVNRLSFQLDAPYSLLEPIRALLVEAEAQLVREAFDAQIHLHYKIPDEEVAAFEQALRDLSAGTVRPRSLEPGARH